MADEKPTPDEEKLPEPPLPDSLEVDPADEEGPSNVDERAEWAKIRMEQRQRQKANETLLPEEGETKDFVPTPQEIPKTENRQRETWPPIPAAPPPEPKLSEPPPAKYIPQPSPPPAKYIPQPPPQKPPPIFAPPDKPPPPPVEDLKPKEGKGLESLPELPPREIEEIQRREKQTERARAKRGILPSPDGMPTAPDFSLAGTAPGGGVDNQQLSQDVEKIKEDLKEVLDILREMKENPPPARFG